MSLFANISNMMYFSKHIYNIYKSHAYQGLVTLIISGCACFPYMCRPGHAHFVRILSRIPAVGLQEDLTFIQIDVEARSKGKKKCFETFFFGPFIDHM